MPIHQETLDSHVVRHAVQEAARELRRDDVVMRTRACEALGIDAPEWSACRNALTEELDEAEDWLERELAITDSGVEAPPVDSQTDGGRQGSIVLTHHLVLSPFRKRGDRLEESLDPFLASGRIFGWFWGHEHHLFEFADYRGVKCRCIGHGSLPYVPPDRRQRRHPAEIVRMETRPSPFLARSWHPRLRPATVRRSGTPHRVH